ncbi:hypothetical protein GGR56DRAFT_591965 [Xylariaceae sp. FL0804]|nr:hypothetical protein GGR56DRAFT_591965 [Xylariaceae sp. FL0804]
MALIAARGFTVAMINGPDLPRSAVGVPGRIVPRRHGPRSLARACVVSLLDALRTDVASVCGPAPAAPSLWPGWPSVWSARAMRVSHNSLESKVQMFAIDWKGAGAGLGSRSLCYTLTSTQQTDLPPCHSIQSTQCHTRWPEPPSRVPDDHLRKICTVDEKHRDLPRKHRDQRLRLWMHRFLTAMYGPAQGEQGSTLGRQKVRWYPYSGRNR